MPGSTTLRLLPRAAACVVAAVLVLSALEGPEAGRLARPAVAPRMAHGQGAGLELIGQIGGRAGSVALDAEARRAFLAVGPRVLVLDLSDPADPRRVGRSDVLDEVVSALALDGDRLYVGGRFGGLWVLDVDLAAGTGPVWRADVGAPVTDLAAADGHLLAVAAERLTWFDTADPDAPRLVAGLDLPDPPTAVDVDGDTAAVVFGRRPSGRLRVLSLEAVPGIQVRSELALTGTPVDTALEGRRAFVLETSAFRVVDLGDVTRPRIVGSSTSLEWHATPPASRLALAGSLAYVAVGRWMDARGDDVVLGGGIEVIDVASPERPTAVGHFLQQPAGAVGGPADVAAGAGVVVAAEPASGLEVLDVADPHDPIWIGGFETGGSAWDVAAEGARAHVATGWGLRTIDLSATPEPRLGAHEPSFGALSFVRSSGDTLFASEYGFMVNRLWWRELGGGRGGGTLEVSVRDVVLDGGFAYFAGAAPTTRGFTGGLDVFDWRDPGMGPLVAGRELGGGLRAEAVARSGSFVYVTDGRELRRFDVTDPADPRADGAPLGLASPRALAATEGHVLVGTATGLVVVDAGPGELRALGAFTLPTGTGPVADLAVRGSDVLVAAGRSIFELDLSRPASPRWLSTCRLPEAALAVDAASERVLVAAGHAGLLVLGRSGSVTATTTAAASSPTTVSPGASPTSPPTGNTPPTGTASAAPTPLPGARAFLPGALRSP